MARPAQTLHDPLHESLHGTPEWDQMSDDEIMAMLSREETQDKFAVSHLEPDGMKYQWMRCEVFGKADTSRPAEAEQKGWRAVPAQRHDGRFMPPGTSGPIIMDGLMLYELPERIYRLKRQISAQVAQNKVADMNAQLSYAPPGTGPRGTHPITKVTTRREAGAMPLVVE